MRSAGSSEPSSSASTPSSRALFNETRTGPSRGPRAPTRSANMSSPRRRLPGSFGTNSNPSGTCSAQRRNWSSAGSRYPVVLSSTVESAPRSSRGTPTGRSPRGRTPVARRIRPARVPTRTLPSGNEYVRGPLAMVETVTVPVERFTEEEQERLALHFTNLDRPVFGLVNLPETVKGRSSRATRATGGRSAACSWTSSPTRSRGPADRRGRGQARRRPVRADLPRLRRRLRRAARQGRSSGWSRRSG